MLCYSNRLAEEYSADLRGATMTKYRWSEANSLNPELLVNWSQLMHVTMFLEGKKNQWQRNWLATIIS